MSKVEIERGPLVGGVLIAVSAAIAIALNTYSSYRDAPAATATAVQSLVSKDESDCCDSAQCNPGESHAKACASDVKVDPR